MAAKEEGSQIRDFVENRLGGAPMLKGAAFYQLVKTEDKIQDYKLIAIRDKESGAIYCGPMARQLIGLPQYGDARVRPDWPNVGKNFTEGKSAR